MTATKASTTARARTIVKARAAASPATMAARVRTLAKATAAATRPNRTNNPRLLPIKVAGAGNILAPALSHAGQSISQFHQLRYRPRTASAALPAHPREKAGLRLVRDH